MFLNILAHHEKNRSIRIDYVRSGWSVSQAFNECLRAILKLAPLLLVNPNSVLEDESDDRCKGFRGCLGALDGTYIQIRVSSKYKPRYKTRKGEIATNVLGVCDRNLNFTYVLPEEGSAADGRVLRNIIMRTNSLKIPEGYTNGNGFLSPYRGYIYWLRDWQGDNPPPQCQEELFNMKHARARNVIERTFGILKGRWGILRSASWYSVKIHNRIISVCCLIQNFIRREMKVDPLDIYMEEQVEYQQDNIDVVESSEEWTTWRDELAQSMWNANLIIDIFNYFVLVICFIVFWIVSSLVFDITDEPKARNMNTKKWPMFADWEELFGKDRATGEHAEGPLDTVEDILKNQTSGLSINMTLGFPINIDEDEDEDEDEDDYGGSHGPNIATGEAENAYTEPSFAGASENEYARGSPHERTDRSEKQAEYAKKSSSNVNKKEKNKKRKRVVEDANETFVKSMTEVIKDYTETQDKRIGALIDKIGIHDHSDTHDQVYAIIESPVFDLYTIEQHIKAKMVICRDMQKMEIFLRISELKRQTLMFMVVNDKL
ncbi:putative ABC transporter B family member 25-like [Capsicum annuum]|nr:putative ABC transporter B family member 25-like [Capsicum annuum]